MKKILLLAICFAPLALVAQNNQYTLKGHIGEENAPAMAYLNYRSGGKTILDSALINNGSFEFKGSIAEPLRAQLQFDHTGVGFKKLGRKADMLPMYLENGNIILTSKDSVKKAVITGSKINAENSAYQKQLLPASEALASINAEYMASSPDQKRDKGFTAGLQARAETASKEKEDIQYRYIKQNPDSYISLVALMEVAGFDIDVPTVEPAYKNLSDGLRNNAAGIEFARSIESARMTSIGAMAPTFTQNDVNDKPVSLSDFRGKYVLLDFWASWCGPCRAENPNVVKAYQAYKDKNFTILGISLDQPGKKDA